MKPTAAPAGGQRLENYKDEDRTFLKGMFGHPWYLLLRRLRKSLERAVTMCALPADARILDLGCAHMQYREFFSAGMDYVGIDLPGNQGAHVVLNPDGTVPLPDQCADLVFSTQVLEHVADPVLYLSEAHRLLKPGGRLVLSTHGVFVYHPDPVDFWRWTSAGLKKLVEDRGFKICEFEGIIGPAGAGLQMFGGSVFKFLPKVVRPVWVIILTGLIWFVDRIQSDHARRREAVIFVLTAST